MTSARLFKDNDMVLEVSGLQNEVSREYLNAASVTVSLADAAGAAVSGATWPLSLSYVTSSNGVYRVTLADSLGISDEAKYIATVTADAGDKLRATWVLDCLGALRNGQ